MFLKLLPVAALLALALMPAPAQAHIVASPNTGSAGGYFQTSLRVAHGCDGKATTAIHVLIPAEIASVHPQMKPGWTLFIVPRPGEQPMHDMPGMKMPEPAVAEIVWRGNTLPANQYDDFGLLMKLPDAPDTTLWLPVTQECGATKVEWTAISAEGQRWHDVPTPAPFIHVTDKTAD